MAYYTISKYVNSGQITPDGVGDPFFDFVFLDRGELGKVSSDSKVPPEALESVKREFQYWYPVNARHSGRDLVPNHLTFFIFNHLAIFPKKYWPEEIVVNGSVLMDGKKMSKSMGNIIPLRSAIRTHGADSIRLAILISAELLQDADFNQEAVRGIKNKLESLIAGSSGLQAPAGEALEQEDRWLQSRLQQAISDTTAAVQKMRLREALHRILYEFESDLEWHAKRSAAKKRQGVPGIMRGIFSTRAAMLSPFAPYTAEEMWQNLGNPGLASQSEWPEPDEAKVDLLALQSESLLRRTLDDIRNIVRVTKMTPRKVTIYTAAPWKAAAYRKILEKVTSGEVNVGGIIRSLISDPATADVKKDPDFVKKTVNDILSEPQGEREAKTRAGLVEEGAAFSELSSLVESEYGIGVEVFSESDPAKYDPKNKARTARPYKPAILIE